ncbi:hypothetical protein, partial [Kaarinaea lacus]
MPHFHQYDQNLDLLALHRVNPQRYPFLLQSVATGTASARFDILFAFPGKEIRLENVNSHAPDFLIELDQQWNECRRKIVDENGDLDGLPFVGGWFLYLG